MILYYFPIAQNTGPVELSFGSNLFSGSLLSVEIFSSEMYCACICMCTYLNIFLFTGLIQVYGHFYCAHSCFSVFFLSMKNNVDSDQMALLPGPAGDGKTQAVPLNT